MKSYGIIECSIICCVYSSFPVAMFPIIRSDGINIDNCFFISKCLWTELRIPFFRTSSTIYSSPSERYVIAQRQSYNKSTSLNLCNNSQKIGIAAETSYSLGSGFPLQRLERTQAITFIISKLVLLSLSYKFSIASIAPYYINKSRYFGLSPATFPIAQRACSAISLIWWFAKLTKHGMTPLSIKDLTWMWDPEAILVIAHVASSWRCGSLSFFINWIRVCTTLASITYWIGAPVFDSTFRSPIAPKCYSNRFIDLILSVIPTKSLS